MTLAYLLPNLDTDGLLEALKSLQYTRRERRVARYTLLHAEETPFLRVSARILRRDIPLAKYLYDLMWDATACDMDSEWFKEARLLQDCTLRSLDDTLDTLCDFYLPQLGPGLFS